MADIRVGFGDASSDFSAIKYIIYLLSMQAGQPKKYKQRF
jgi:hypothetical protein